MLYYALTVFFFCLQFMRLFDDKAEGNLQTLAGITVAGMYAFTLWITGRYHYPYYASGGYRGFTELSKE